MITRAEVIRAGMNHFQIAAGETYLGAGIEYLALGLCGESGEVAEHLKKRIRDGHLDLAAVKKELGDVLWYVAVLANELGLTLGDVANTNVLKLAKRQMENKLKGSGSER